MHESIASGKEIPVDEILSLASGVQALFLVVTLESRALAHVEDRRLIWAEVADLFDELCLLWADAGSDDPRIRWLIQRLEQCRELAQDQTQLYQIRPSERRRHALCREAAIKAYGVRGERNESRPDGWRDQSTPAHVYSLGHF